MVSVSHKARADSSAGTALVPRITVSMVMVDPVSTGGDTVARRSVPVPSSIVRTSTLPLRYGGGVTTARADSTTGGGTSRMVIGSVSMSSVRKSTSIDSPSVSTKRSKAPSG